MAANITIIGLGPSGSEHWTQAARRLLDEANKVYFRTAQHPSVVEITAQAQTFDDWYAHGDNDEEIHGQVAAEIVRLAQQGDELFYAVPGHPTMDEATVPIIRTLAKAANLRVTIVPGLSYFDATLSALNLDGRSNLQLVDAAEVAALHHPSLEAGRPALISCLRSQGMAAQVKKTLLNAYAGDFMVTLVKAAGTDAERVWSCPLAALNEQSGLEARTILYLPADSVQSSFSTFQETIAHLRAPEGCPWDREQTHKTLRPYLLEESYEVLEALDADDPEALAEELGDLLLQIVLHAQIAVDTGEFKMGTIIDHINRKLLRRHPHVFGDIVVSSVADVATNWEAIKKGEKAAKGQAVRTVSALDGIPRALPALAEAMVVSKKAVRVGFEWSDIDGVLEKVVEEAQEIAEASDPAHLESEIGDLLFCIVNLARWRNIEPESALRATNARFSQRFRLMERLAVEQGKSLADMSIREMDLLWDEAKRQL